MELDKNIDDETVRLGLQAILPGHDVNVWRVLGTGVSAVVVGACVYPAGSNPGHARNLALRFEASASEQSARRDHGLLNYLYARGLPVPACHGVARLARSDAANQMDLVVTAMLAESATAALGDA